MPLNRFEGDWSAYYFHLIGQLGYDASFTADLTKHFLDIRKGCMGEIQAMRGLVDKLHPTPLYTTYRGATEFSPGRYGCHPGRDKTLAKAILNLHDGRDGFTADAANKLVAATSGVLIPVVEAYGHVLESSSVTTLPNSHLAIELYSHALTVIDRASKGGASIEF